jgi:hypothetical protein
VSAVLFHALFGFAAGVALILGGRFLAQILGRGEAIDAE